MSLYSRRWFCALSGSVRGRVSEFRDAHKARYDCLSLCADLNKKNCVRCNRQARRAQSRRACSFNVWPPSGWIIRDVLAGTHYEITEAEDGEHALAAVAKQRPDLILMEIQLPSMDGYETMRRIRTDPALISTPIIAVSSYAPSEEQRKARAAGCNDFLPKPYSPHQLLARIRNYLQ